MSGSTPDQLPLPDAGPAAAFLHLPELREGLEPHQHSALQLIVVVFGRLRLEAASQSWSVASPAGIVVWPEVLHAAAADGGRVELLTLQLDRHAMDTAAQTAGRTLEAPATGILPLATVGPVIREVAFELASVATGGRVDPFVSQTYRFLCHALARRIAQEQRAATSPRSGIATQTFASEYVERAVNHMRAHLAPPLELTQIARRAGTSPRNLARAFTSDVGMPPSRFYTLLRIEQAAYRLISSDDDVQDIATGLGFRSLSHFGRAFRSAKGSTPLEYRARQRTRRS